MNTLKPYIDSTIICISILICFTHIEYLLWMFVMWFIIEYLLNNEIKNTKLKPINQATINYRVELACTLEIILCFYSIFLLNTIKSVFVIINLILLYRLIRSTVTNQRQLDYIKIFINIIAFVFALVTILSFGFHYLRFSRVNIEDLSYLKHFYTPLGIIANDWAAIFICFLPFPFSLLYTYANKVKLILIGISSFILYAILITLSRGAILSVLSFFLCLFIFTFLWKREYVKKLSIQILTILVISFTLCVPIKQSLITTLEMTKTISQKRSIEGRISKWEESLYLFQQHPIVGVGAGNYAFASYNIRGKNKKQFNPRCTNSYLQILVEKGLIGAAMYSYLLAYVFIASYRKMKTGHWDCIVFSAGLVALCVKEFFFSSLLENQIVLTMGILIIFFIRFSPVNTKIVST
ncbi:O-antigen ligase family protein [Bacteroides graminisolvens]|uniref:O-antigen ligase family protein n=1 Tax=Bacteroides graminisolvens TaxID=477666 RepID=UPI0023F57316|nr:O-antigen ligase family protein [Bacteroides graminisolvens]